MPNIAVGRGAGKGQRQQHAERDKDANEDYRLPHAPCLPTLSNTVHVGFHAGAVRIMQQQYRHCAGAVLNQCRSSMESSRSTYISRAGILLLYPKKHCAIVCYASTLSFIIAYCRFVSL